MSSGYNRMKFQNSSDIKQLAEERFLAFLKEQGARKTPERMATLRCVYEMVGHFEVDQLYAKLLKESPGISRATVYNTLELLLRAKLVMKLQFGENRAYYERTIGAKQHDHLICNQCQQLLEFCDPGIQQIKDQMGEILQFHITHHTLILYGDCKKKSCPNLMK